MSLIEHCITPEWPAPKNVRALQTTRAGGVSAAPYDTLNLGDHVGDDPMHVAQNRQRLASILPSEPVWLKQVHGVQVANADIGACSIEADAAVATQKNSVCVVMTADCLPILLCDNAGTVVAAVHAGWRSLCDGIVERTIAAMKVDPHTLIAWLGPAISQPAFEVGEEVRAAFIAKSAEAEEAFAPGHAPGKWQADLYLLARQRLHAAGVRQAFGGGLCTHREPQRFFSYRRDGATGRMGTFIWLA